MALDSMRAAVCTGPGQIGPETLPVPEPRPAEVRVRVRACGICGSDLSLLPVGYLSTRVVPGHEIMGEVDAVGADVTDFSPGDPVAIEPLVSCGDCPACNSGRDAICQDVAILGVHRDGGFAEYVTAPARRLFRLPTGLPPQLGALAEPMAVMVHGLRRGGFRAGQRVLLLGAGNLGLLGSVAARRLGAAEVWVTARYEHQARLAEELGATRVLAEGDASAASLDTLGREFPFDCVVETVGGEADTLNLAARAVRPGGIISVVGVFRGAVTLDPFPLFMKEATLAWSNCYEHPHDDADFAAAVRLLDENRDDLLRLTTHQVGLEEIQRAFQLAATKKAGPIKVTVLV